MEKAIKLGGDYLSLKDVAKSGYGILVIARVVEFHPYEPAETFDGWRYPVTSDWCVASGPRYGEVWASERVFGAITAQLRGVRNARKDKNETPQAPRFRVGIEIGMRLQLLNEGKNNESVGGNPPSDAEWDALAKAYADILGPSDPATAPQRWAAVAAKQKAAREAAEMAASGLSGPAEMAAPGAGMAMAGAGLGAPGAPAEAPPWVQ